MLKGKNDIDYNYTARLGILFSLIFILLVFMGSCVEPQSELISPVSPFKAVEVQAVEPTPTPIKSQKELIIQEIENVFGEQGDLAQRVAFCESSLIPTKESKVSSAKGLFQILSGTWKAFKCSGDPLDYKDNISCAKKIYDYYGEFGTSGGWRASKGCWNER